MNPISRICIATHRKDLRFARICVASIRARYPQIPIYLIKDVLNGDFSTTEVEEHFDVRIFTGDYNRFGWGLSKLEPLFESTGDRFLVLDSDTVVAGPILEFLQTIDADFIVDKETQSEDVLRSIYFAPEAVRQLDPAYVYPGFSFNTGQFVATGGELHRQDFEHLVDWSTVPPTIRHPEIFKNGEQGVLNYVLQKKAAEGKITIARVPLMLWPGYEKEMNALDPTLVTSGPGVPKIIHWAGFKSRALRLLPGSAILQHFEQQYYSQVDFGDWKRRLRAVSAFLAGVTPRAAFRRIVSAGGARR